MGTWGSSPTFRPVIVCKLVRLALLIYEFVEDRVPQTGTPVLKTEKNTVV